MRTIIGTIVLALLLAVLGTADAQTLVLWNKLGSLTEVQNSEVGANGIIGGTPGFAACQFGSGFNRTQVLNDFVCFPSALASANQFTIEYWVQFSGAIPSSLSPALPVFMVTFSNQNRSCFGDIRLSSDGQVTVTLWPYGGYVLIYRWYGYSWPANEKHHMAFVYDNAASAGNRVKFYFDGVLQTGPTLSMDNTWNSSQPVSVLAGVTMPTFVGADCMLDNLKIYQGIKTDFSDRFTENAGAAVTVSSNLIFWNKLGSAAEVQSSEAGVNGVIVGTPSYLPVEYGNGIGNFPDGNTYVKFDNLFGSTAYPAFTVEYWVNWKEGGTDDYSFLTAQQTATTFGAPAFYISLGDDPTGKFWTVQLAWSAGSYITYSWWHPHDNNDVVEHIAFTVDLSKPFGQKIRFFINGTDQGLPNINYASCETAPQASIVLPPYVRINESTPGNWIFRSYVDNMKVWSFAKTDFSDRFTEDGSVVVTPPASTNAPSAPAGLQSTAGSEVVNLNWETVSGAVSYKVYRSETSGFTPGPATLLGPTSGHTWHDTSVRNDTRYFYVVTAENAYGESLPSNEVWATPGHQQHNLLLKGGKFSASKGEKVTVTYNVAVNAKVKIRIYDANGSLVDETADMYLPVGSYDHDWTGVDKTGKIVPPGVYTMQLFVNDKLEDTQKAIVTK